MLRRIFCAAAVAMLVAPALTAAAHAAAIRGFIDTTSDVRHLELINEVRAASLDHPPAIELSEELTRAARIRAAEIAQSYEREYNKGNTNYKPTDPSIKDDLSNTFSHWRPGSDRTGEYPDFYTAVSEDEAFMNEYGWMYENLACGTIKNAEEVIDGWCKSTGHRENMLAVSNRYVGVARYVTTNGVSFWVQMYAQSLPSSDPVRSPNNSVVSVEAGKMSGCGTAAVCEFGSGATQGASAGALDKVIEAARATYGYTLLIAAQTTGGANAALLTRLGKSALLGDKGVNIVLVAYGGDGSTIADVRAPIASNAPALLSAANARALNDYDGAAWGGAIKSCGTALFGDKFMTETGVSDPLIVLYKGADIRGYSQGPSGAPGADLIAEWEKTIAALRASDPSGGNDEGGANDDGGKEDGGKDEGGKDEGDGEGKDDEDDSGAATVFFTVTTRANDVRMGTVAADADRVAKGAKVTLTASPVKGYKLSHWLINGVRVEASGASVTFAAESNIVAEAVFVKEETDTGTPSEGESDTDGGNTDSGSTQPDEGSTKPDGGDTKPDGDNTDDGNTKPDGSNADGDNTGGGGSQSDAPVVTGTPEASTITTVVGGKEVEENLPAPRAALAEKLAAMPSDIGTTIRQKLAFGVRDTIGINAVTHRAKDSSVILTNSNVDNAAVTVYSDERFAHDVILLKRDGASDFIEDRAKDGARVTVRVKNSGGAAIVSADGVISDGSCRFRLDSRKILDADGRSAASALWDLFAAADNASYTIDVSMDDSPDVLLSTLLHIMQRDSSETAQPVSPAGGDGSGGGCAASGAAAALAASALAVARRRGMRRE